MRVTIENHFATKISVLVVIFLAKESLVILMYQAGSVQ